MGLQPGVDYYVRGPSKRQRLLYAAETMYRRSGQPKRLALLVRGGDPEGHKPPSHISKTVLSTVYVGGPERTVLRTFRWEVQL